MAVKLFSLLETSVTWAERLQRTPWGGKLVALAITAALAIAQLVYGLPVVLVIPLAIVTFAALVVIVLFLPRFLNRFWPIPFIVTVQTRAVGEAKVQTHVLILNKHATRRIALVIDLCLMGPDGRGQWYHTAEPHKVRLQLGPDEFEEGVIAFRVEKQALDLREGVWCMRVADMVSARRTKLFRIPGSYPSDAPILKSQKRAQFVKGPDEQLEITHYWGAELGPHQ